MFEYDFDNDTFRFPLSVHLHGEELLLRVQAVVFSGGIFYTVRGAGMATLHIMCTYSDEQEDGKPRFTIMNKDSFGDAVIAAVLRALCQPIEEEQPTEKVPGGFLFG